jgi:hypothetical protein
LTARIDPSANIGKYLGIESRRPTTPSSSTSVFKTNEDTLITTAVEGVVQPARGGGGYSTSYDGTPKMLLGMASINYTVSLLDLAHGWAQADHVEPDVTIQGCDKPRASDCALAILARIGNEARVVSGEAKGGKGLYIGRLAGSDDLVWFPDDVVEKLALNDRIQVKARGVGLEIDGYEDVRVNKASPGLLENLGITIEGGELVVPVVLEVPGHIMGSGMGGSFANPSP